MTVLELKKCLEWYDDMSEVAICVDTPAGWVCPDGAIVGVKNVTMGIDWNLGFTLLVPQYRLEIHDVEAWAKRKGEG